MVDVDDLDCLMFCATGLIVVVVVVVVMLARGLKERLEVGLEGGSDACSGPVRWAFEALLDAYLRVATWYECSMPSTFSVV